MKQSFPLSLLVTLFVLLFPALAPAQTAASGHWNSGLEPATEHADCIPAPERAAVTAVVDANVAGLTSKGVLPEAAPESVVYFVWPLRLRAGLTDPSYYGISNYVDENSGTGILDYNCGSRTYDGHRGTDIYNWPFPWAKMATNDVEVVAAAAGVIVYKADGNFDQNCSWNNQTGNGMIIQHADGSRAWYWHFKKFTLTTKGVGASVAAGEYLGVVGSSGISTGPHLHFEVDNGGNESLRDPWGGNCNYLGGQSWWQSQRPYYDPKILKVMTHNAAPTMSQCPGGEVVNASNNFQPNQLAYFAGYFRDYLPGTNATYTVRGPNGSIWNTWTVSNVTSYYGTAWWWWSAYLPGNVNGTWSFQVSYQGQSVTHYFNVGAVTTCNTPSGLSATNITQNSATLNWSPVAGAANYTVQYQLGSSTTWYTAGTTSATSMSVTGLSPATLFTWRVRTNCTNGVSSAYSNTSSFTTQTPPNTCPAPAWLQAVNVAQNTATLQWAPVTGALNYTVQFYTNNTWTNLGGSATTGTSVGIYGLYANSSYTWRVRANCSSGSGQYSTASTFSTLTVNNCSSIGTQYPSGALTPQTYWQYQSLMWGGEYCLVNVTSGQTYTFSYCSANGGVMTFDGEISLRTTSNQLIAYADDVCSTQPKITWRAGFTGQVRVLLTRYPCLAQNTNSTMAYRIGTGSAADGPADDVKPDLMAWALPTAADAPHWTVDLGDAADRDAEPVVEAVLVPSILTLLPNPASTAFTIRLDNNGAASRGQMRLLDLMGRVHLTETLALEPGRNEWIVPAGAPPAGMYVVQLVTDDGRQFSERIQLLK